MMRAKRATSQASGPLATSRQPRAGDAWRQAPRPQQRRTGARLSQACPRRGTCFSVCEQYARSVVFRSWVQPRFGSGGGLPTLPIIGFHASNEPRATTTAFHFAPFLPSGVDGTVEVRFSVNVAVAHCGAFRQHIPHMCARTRAASLDQQASHRCLNLSCIRSKHATSRTLLCNPRVTR
jgi:hypothetical protein